jgi:hypothetical protein
MQGRERREGGIKNAVTSGVTCETALLKAKCRARQRGRVRRLLVPATCDATAYYIGAIGPCDSLAAARMAKCVGMPSKRG